MKLIFWEKNAIIMSKFKGCLLIQVGGWGGAYLSIYSLYSMLEYF